MARRAVSISKATSAVSAALVMLLVLVPIGAVAMRAGFSEGAFAGLGVADWAALKFTVVQAGLSALFSAALAVPVARALARRQFWGRGALVLLMGAPFILPVIVAVMGLLAVFGQAGVLNGVLSALGLPKLQIYGLHGVVLAHVFFNLPLATRLLLQGWDAIPQERFRLAASLGMGSREVFRLLEWPMLKERLPAVVLVVFLICLSSFAVALTLGGGPAATTLELAIYQAFHLEFDLAQAALLALMQLVLVLVVGMVALRLGQVAGFGAGRGALRQRWDAGAPLLKAQDALVLSLAVVFIGLPLAVVVLRGAVQIMSLPASVWSAALTSLVIALGSTVLCIAAALALGADGILLGSRMTVAEEIWADDKYKKRITETVESDTRIVMSIFNDNSRVLDNATAKAVNELEEQGIKEFEQYRPLVQGPNQRDAYASGDFDQGTLSMGQSCAFANKIASVENIFDDILRDAVAMRDRLGGLAVENG